MTITHGLDDDIGPRGGLICAYRFEDGRAAPAQGPLVAGAPVPTGWSWTHLALGDKRARTLIERMGDLPGAAKEAFGTLETRIHVDHQGGWVFGVIPDIERDLGGRAQGAGRLYFALDETRLITARLHALRGTDNLRRDVDAGRAFATPAEALARLVALYFENLEEVFDGLGDELARIEDKVLLGASNLNDLGLSRLRRDLSRYRRDLQALRTGLTRALGGRAGRRAALIADQLPALISDVEDMEREVTGLEDRSRLLHEEVDTLINSATNRSMRVLTIISTLLIPPTLITGAFGMNVADVPFEHSPQGFAVVAMICVATTGGLLWLLRRMGML